MKRKSKNIAEAYFFSFLSYLVTKWIFSDLYYFMPKYLYPRLSIVSIFFALSFGFLTYKLYKLIIWAFTD